MFDSSFNKPPSRNSAFTDLFYSENRVLILCFEEGYFENSKKLESILIGSNFFYKQSPHLVPSLSKKKISSLPLLPI